MDTVARMELTESWFEGCRAPVAAWSAARKADGSLMPVMGGGVILAGTRLKRDKCREGVSE